MKLGRLIARAIIGALFAGHGAQKLLGWFGGHGIEGTAGFMDSIGLRPGRRNAIASGVTETAGGALLIAGMLTPLAAAALIATMITAIRTVHLKNGPWASDGGYEYNLVVIAALLALVDGGPGAAAFDRKLGLHETGAVWAIAALLAGAAGSTFVIETAEAAPVTA